MENSCPIAENFQDSEAYNQALYEYTVDQWPQFYIAFALGSCVYVDHQSSFSYDSCDTLSNQVVVKKYSSSDCNSGSLLETSAFNYSGIDSDYCQINPDFYSSITGEPFTVYFSCTKFDDINGIVPPVINGYYAVRSFFGG